jgi:hypothetical protein
MKRLVLAALSAALMSGPLPALAHGTAGVIAVASTADGGGALAAEFDFDAVLKVDFSASLPPFSVYSGIIPAFEELDADDVLESLYVLDVGTIVSLQVTGIDAGLTAVKIGPTTLDAVGDSAVIGTAPFGHTHPQYQLLLELPEGEFGEGRISFKLTASGPTSYAESEIYTVKISNGPLPVIDYDTALEDKASVKCMAAASKAAATFAAATQSALNKCLGKVEVLRAREALTVPPGNLASAEAAAEKACADAAGSGPDSGTMLGRIEAARAKAVASIDAACGAGGSADFSADDIAQHLGLVSCRTQELVAATHGVAHFNLEEFTARASQGGAPIADSLPCLVPTAAE